MGKGPMICSVKPPATSLTMQKLSDRLYSIRLIVIPGISIGLSLRTEMAWFGKQVTFKKVYNCLIVNCKLYLSVQKVEEGKQKKTTFFSIEAAWNNFLAHVFDSNFSVNSFCH